MKIFNAIIIVSSIPLSIGFIGFLLVAFGFITAKNSQKFAILISTLLASAEMWIASHFHIDLGQGNFDLFILFFVIWFFTYFVFWIGMVLGLKKFQKSLHGQMHDFGHSSILSMQYVETRMADDARQSHQ
jgi:hypothetical protein